MSNHAALARAEANWYDLPDEPYYPEMCPWCLEWFKHPDEEHPACELAIEQHMCHNEECPRCRDLSIFVDYDLGDPCEECGSPLGAS